MQENDQLFSAAKSLFRVWSEIATKLQSNPTELTQSQWAFWQKYLHLAKSNAEDFSFDKRFKHEEWKNNFLLDLIKRSYILFSQHNDELIDNIAQGDERSARKLRFYMQQFTDAIAPTNFGALNPDVFSETINTSGLNLARGLKQFFADLDLGTGKINAKMVDMKYFKVGKNLAITPGRVIYRNDLIELIEYKPTTKEIYETPLLIIPPWVNKYYILDLQAEDSYVKWLVAQGIHVYMISWVNPTSKHRHKTFSDYLTEGGLAALNEVKKHNEVEQVNIVGYCIGGTLTSCMLAYLAKKRNDSVRSATFLTTLLDFSDPGDLGAFIDEKQIEDIECSMEKEGYLDGNILAATFNALRANDLVWGTFINNYLKGQKPKQFDLLYWNADPTNIPAQVHSFYMRNMYMNNYLVKSNKIILHDENIDLKLVKTPAFFLATKDDHIIPWKSCYQSQQHLSSKVTFVLSASGHVAGVVNPPQRNKYGYWTNSKLPKTADKYFEGAKYHEGSWWPEWFKWLQQYAGDKKEYDETQQSQTKSLGDAPGKYVKKKIKM